jgi:uncharacterized caspase-like protein
VGGSRSALIVANDRYDDTSLRELAAPAQDADALAAALADPAIGGFDVAVLRNVSAQELRVAVEDFFADRHPEDLLLLHFSCHGLKNAAGELYLAVADTRPARLASTAVAADFVNRQMADSRAQRIVLFLDCCYGGAFPRGMVVRGAGEAQVRDAFAGQESVGGGRGRVVVTASRAMEYAFEGDRLAGGTAAGPSVFTGAVVEGLTTGEADRDGDGWVGLSELVGYVSDRVQRVTPHQNPQMWTFGAQGELLLARSRGRRVTPAALPPELLEAMESPLAAVRYGVADDLAARLDDRDLAQAYAAFLALRRMVDDDSRKVSDAARRGVDTAVVRVPPVIDLDADGAGELTLTGPPIARAAVAAPREAWLAVRQDGAVVHLHATPQGPGPHEGTLVVTGPTGEATVTVTVRTTAEAGPEAVTEPHPEAAAEPAPGPGPEAATEPAADAAEPQPEPTPQPAPASEREPVVAANLGPVPWWAIALLVAGAVALLLVSWPDPDVRSWEDPYRGWYVNESWRDIVIPVALLAAALWLRWVRELLGVMVGLTLYTAVSAFVILAAGLAHQQTKDWLAVLSIGVAMTAAAWVAGRVRVRYRGPVYGPARCWCWSARAPS